MERSTNFSWENSRTKWWMFHSYVKLPDANWQTFGETLGSQTLQGAKWRCASGENLRLRFEDFTTGISLGKGI
jgi:hypothetical protein